MPRARQLSERVAFDQREVVSDSLGSVEGAFVQRFVCAAGIRAKLGGEAVTAARLASQQPVVITVRQSSQTLQVEADWRVRDMRDGTIYNIRSIADPDSDGAWLEMLCQSGAGA
jgi:head-tail adaptor